MHETQCGRHLLGPGIYQYTAVCVVVCAWYGAWFIGASAPTAFSMATILSLPQEESKQISS